MEFEERYFREELDYLRQLSKLLATEKPHLARFLAEKDADPDIERLLEGVAFLTGNLRQKIEDEFPELTHGLIKMLWPNYLRPVPAMTLIEYTPDMDKSSVPVLIPRNEQFTTNAGEIRVDEVLPSDAKKEEPPPCTFTLCRDIWLLPVRLEQIENRSTTRNGVINITFSVAPGTDFRTLDLNKLRFWLGNDDNYTRDQLYLWFCEYLQGADLTVGEQHIRLPEFMLKAVGFEPQDAMLPWPKNVHSGYRILQEYFCYPDAFLFFDLCGCPALPDGLQAEFFTLQLRFSRPLPVDIRLRRDSLRLYCAPAINLFIHHAEAITLDNRRADYPLVPSRHYPQHYDVFSVNSVVSQVQDMFRKKDLGRPVSTQAARQWPAFESFSHQMEYSRKREVVYWHHRTKTSLFHRGFDHTLAFTGSDPRGLPEFSAIREEINKASHPSQPELNWKLVESLALAIFKANGVDLHTATYYTLARTRTQGLAGFCEGAELLAAMVSHDWDKFWPQGGPARTEMLDWFNSRTGNILRQQISFAESDLPLIYRTERALQLICDKLQQVELKRVPRVENLLYFMQNTRKRLEPQLKSNTENAAQTTVRTLIYAPETQASSTPEAVVPPLPGLPEMKVEVRSLTENPPQASVIKQGSTVRGFIAGIACSVAVASALWWWQVYPVQQQLLQVNDTAQGAATVWMASPELENYERRLQQLLDTSPVQPLETGMQMMRVADSRWPESLQQQQASTQWNEALKTRAQSSPQLRGWLQTRQDLHAFADLVMQREKEGLTLSYIKNVIWQAERGLGQETPVESLLTQYQDARAQKQNTDALEKQINERLEGVLSRWLLLKNNVMPEAATGTTAEK
ncbi:TPA: type VI secretion system baseplate subunit TssF [Escherichia coli]|nr:type VI secretion system baseplate subunit TssF [Escherichia coli]EEW8217909.1 type VI secretion system baseplate subunit TssF [Escherichia coli]EFB1654848.1 type VI secretion system baseplate subunit TssF [Escherichia coli]EFB2568054.1 type VI secretion system baseplate subunit TssF [Escherichia coli]EFB5290972.1 type VI secretion system baseplate subunit TssF [Escherichia coli]